MDRSEFEKSARRYLDLIRLGEGYKAWFKHLRSNIAQGELRLADISTSEEELAELWVKGGQLTARQWLGALRQGTPQYKKCFTYLMQEVENGMSTLADIGTSEDELKDLHTKGCRAAAEQWLGVLRQGDENYKGHIMYLRMEVTRGGLSLNDIGTSEKEIDELWVKGCKTAACAWLNFIQSEMCTEEEYEPCLGYLMQEIANGMLMLEDIGTSEDELSSLM